MLTLFIPLKTHPVRRICYLLKTVHRNWTFFFSSFLTFNLPNSARSKSSSKPLEELAKKTPLEAIRMWVNSTKGLSQGKKGGFCPYIIQVFFHDSCRYSMHGSRAGHTALCKNNLQPCQRSLPLPLYYTHLTRCGLQCAHSQTQKQTAACPWSW